ESSLIGMQRQPALGKALPHLRQEPFGFVAMLEAQDERDGTLARIIHESASRECEMSVGCKVRWRAAPQSGLYTPSRSGPAAGRRRPRSDRARSRGLMNNGHGHMAATMDARGCRIAPCA